MSRFACSLRSLFLRAALFACVPALCLTATQAQQPKVLAPHKPGPQRVASVQPQAFSKPPVLRSHLGGLWMTDGSMKSYLHITNDLVTSPLSVTPILWLSNGSKLSLPPVSIEPSGTVVLSINQSLADQGIAPFATLSGYVEIQYEWPWDALCVTVRNVDVAHSLIFNYGLPLTVQSGGAGGPVAQGAEQRLEGLWWKQEPNVVGFLTVTNPGSVGLTGKFFVTDAQDNPLSQQSFTVDPHHTKMLELAGLPQAEGSVGGLRVQYLGQPNGLLVFGGLRDDATGYSATIGLSPPPLSVTTYAEPGLMTGAADPMLSFPAGTTFTPFTVARNIASQPVVITPRLWWMAEGTAKTAALPQFSLAPLESRNLNVPVLLGSGGLKEFNGSVNLVLDTAGNAAPGSILLSSGSVDSKNTYVFPVVPVEVKESIAKNLSYWSTARGDDTMVTLWNPADEEQHFLFTLFYAGGHYRYPIQLQPRATLMFNISEILHTAIPDDEGNLIPSGIYEGSAVLSGLQGEAEHILVVMDAATYNVQKAICGGFCATCEGAVSSWITDTPFALAFSSVHQLTFSLLNHNMAQYDDTGLATWTSSNTNIATMSTTKGKVVSGVATGSVTISARDASYPNYVSGCGFGQPMSCPIQSGISASAYGTVYTTPQITGIAPSSWTSGSTTQVTLTGQAFGSNAPTLNFSPGTGISYSLLSYNDTQIVASIAVASGTPNENVSVAVTNNGYGGNPFQGQSVGASPISPGIFATVHSPLNTPEVTVIAWVNGQAPDLQTLPAGNQLLVTHLNSTAAACAIEVGLWVSNVAVDLVTQTDRDYANAWLVKYSANPAPPSTILPSAQLSLGNFRLINDSGHGTGFYQVGKTPDPCSIKFPPLALILNWGSGGQASQYMGKSDTLTSGKFYQLAEGRVGSAGQAGSFTINKRTVPWIWSVIEFDSAGNPTYSDVATFPTYSVYVNGSLVKSYPQSSVASFVLKDETSQRTPSQIQ